MKDLSAGIFSSSSRMLRKRVNLYHQKDNFDFVVTNKTFLSQNSSYKQPFHDLGWASFKDIDAIESW